MTKHMLSAILWDGEICTSFSPNDKT